MSRAKFEQTIPPQWRRRDVVRLGAALGLGKSFGTSVGTTGTIRLPRRGHGGRTASGQLDPNPMVIIDGADVRALALRALDATRAAGASYADVRLTRLLTQTCEPGGRPVRGAGDFSESETLGVGVRVRIGDGWGFAASPYWNLDEIPTLVREAVTEARANAAGAPRVAAWAPIPVASGHWATPIRVDPFIMPIEEKIDYLGACESMASRYRGCEGHWTGLGWTREEQAVATSEGSYFTQALYTTGGSYTFGRRALTKNGMEGSSAVAQGVQPSMGAGWEVFTEADIPNQLPVLYEQAAPHRPRPVPVKPGEIGRYPVVFSAGAMASLLARTLGVATQLDRALGYDANADGTSYLGPDPLALLGSFQAASPLVTVTANRSMPRGLATVKWDAEGVEPEDVTLIKDGVLVDYQTTRELAPLLASAYQKQGKPVRSHGCAAAQDATFITTQHVPNLVLEPGREALSFQDLVQDTKRGLAVLGGDIATDFQVRTGSGSNLALVEIINGQLGATVTKLDCLFTTTALWRNVVALGGAMGAVAGGASHTKGQPAQTCAFTVRAVPALVKDVDFIDPTRRA